MTIYNKTIFRQADSRWGSLPYPTSSYKFAGNGCGCCAVTHCAIELENFKNYTPADVRKYMVQFATRGNGTLWNGITKGLENYGFNVHWRQADTMADIWKVLAKSLKKGVILFGSSKGGTKRITWTTGGHYVAFVDWKYENGDYWFYCKDSGGRKHDGWFSYRQHMAGDVRNVWICTSLKSGYKFIGSSTTPTPKPSTPTNKKYVTYSGAFPTKTIKQGSKGTQVTRWQKYLQWMGYSLKADGKFGGITRAKTIAAQKKFGFTGKDVDGIVGSKTIAKAKVYQKQVNLPATKSTPKPAQAPTPTLKSRRIEVDLTNQICTVYGVYSNNTTKPIMSEFVSTAKSGCTTPIGNFKIQPAKDGRPAKSRTAMMSSKKSYAEFLCRFHEGKCMHTVPYSQRQTEGKVFKKEFNKLGSPASAGCVRMPYKLAKYIYESCPIGTPVIVFKGTKGKYPMGKPIKYKATTNLDPTK